MAVRTVFTMAEDCARGERLGWSEFVRDYGSIARALLEHYFPALTPEAGVHLVASFHHARAGENAWFRELRFTNEREFLMAFRGLVFAYARTVDRVPAPEISLDQVKAIMRDLTLVQRAFLWMFAKGYDAPRIAQIMMNAEATAQAAKEISHQGWSQLLPGASPQAWKLSTRVLLESAEKAATPECLSLKVLNNLVNGQVTWRERELAEQHLAGCFHCLDRFTSFQEMIRLRNDCAPLPLTEVEAILSRLDLAPATPKGILRKLFSKAS